MFSKHFRFRVRHLDFRWNGASHKVGNYTIELLDPENMGVDTGIMSVSRPVPKLQGGCNFASPPRRLRYKIRSAVRGLSFVKCEFCKLCCKFTQIKSVNLR